MTGDGIVSKVEPVTERWAYAGVRVLSGKRVHAWLTDSGTGEELLFARSGSFAIGEIYRVTVSRTQGRTTLHGTPTYRADGRLPSDLAARLHGADIAARALLALARQERAAAKRHDLDELLEPLRVIAATMPTRADRTAFLAYVVQELSAAFPRRAEPSGGDR